jgi:Flp pilus assembly pilin Flp
MTTMIHELLNDERGASMAEYALLLALIAVACIAAISSLRDSVIGVFDRASTALGSAT